MDKVGRPRGLIAYDTLAQSGGGGRKEHASRAAAACGRAPCSMPALYRGRRRIMLVGLLLRPTLDVNVLRDRNPLFVKLSDGGVRNGYTLKILNKLHEPRVQPRA